MDNADKKDLQIDKEEFERRMKQANKVNWGEILEVVLSIAVPTAIAFGTAAATTAGSRYGNHIANKRGWDCP